MSDDPKAGQRVFAALAGLVAARLWQVSALAGGAWGLVTVGPEGALVAAAAFTILQANLPPPPD